MIDYGKELVSVLNTILPTFYEMTLTTNTPTPCISWMEMSNTPITDTTGDNKTLGYYRLVFRIKVWGNELGEINSYVGEIHKALRPLGFSLSVNGELYDNASTMIQKILTAEATALVDFN